MSRKLPQLGDSRGGVLRAEYGAACDEHISARLCRNCDGRGVDAAVHLNIKINAPALSFTAQGFDFSIVSGIKDCPPKPGSTVITSAIESLSR